MKGVQSIEEEVITGFERIAENFPDRIALVYLGEKFTYDQLRDLIYRFAAALYELGVRDNDRVMLYIPNCPQWLIAFLAIQKIGGVPVPNVDAILESIQHYKVTLLLGVPTLYRMILENDRLDMYDLSSLKYCWSGGDVLPVEVFNRFKDLTGQPIYQVYGSTEVGHLCLSSMAKDPAPQSLGTPFKSREIRIVDPDTLEEVSPGEVGELLVTSEFILDYWNKPEETAESFVQKFLHI